VTYARANSGRPAKRPMARTLGASLPIDASTLSIVANLEALDLDGLRRQWRAHLGGEAPAHLSRWLLMKVLAYRLQSDAFGDLDKSIRRILRSGKEDGVGAPFDRRAPRTREGLGLKAGALLVREWNGRLEWVMILDEGFAWNGQTFGSLSQIAKAMTGTNWNGHRFFGLRQGKMPRRTRARIAERAERGPLPIERMARRRGTRPMKDQMTKRSLRCAIYTRVSTDQGLEQDFNSLDAQREASEAYIKSQAHEGWRLIGNHYDDGGFSGGSMVRPALQKLLIDVQARRIDVIVVYKVDRLTRSLADFAKLVEAFDAHGVSFVSVTQSFNTTTSMGRLTLNVLLSFAQFEREVTGERIRDKIAASKKRECGWAAWFPWVTESRAARCISSGIMPRSCALYSGDISRREASWPQTATGR
jgi:predicted site-specific integrase-resolvase